MLRGKFAPFFQEPVFSVQNPVRGDNSGRRPAIRITADEETKISLILAKSGFYGGDPDKVLDAPIDKVLQAYQYEMFLREYETTARELNKEGK